MRAAIHDPYLDTLGGGERYTMTVAQILKKKGWDVDVEWRETGILKKLEARLGLDLFGINVVDTINKDRHYDLVFWLSDGSIPLLLGKKNILHFQVPFRRVGGKSLFNQLKLKKIDTVICNSSFTKKFIDKEYGVKSSVIYPPVDVESFRPAGKENIILSVGRFSQLLQSKGQDVLVDVFKKMVDKGLSGWKLNLAGGTDVGGKEFVKKLRKGTKNYPIEIIENPDFLTLKKLYGKSKIFWSASGFEVDEEKEPEKVEHFGITVVESMAAGCIPIVLSAGGHKEIIKEPDNGFLWKTSDELLEKTKKLASNEKERVKIANQARLSSKRFSQERFEEEIGKLLA